MPLRRAIPLLACLLPAVLASAGELLWPLPLPERFLTSDFMEYREGRFHAGLDLKTRERTGFPVLACEDGWIERIRLSPNGYGKAIYLHGRSGRTYVFAHLERLADRWRGAVRRAQQRRGRYAVALSFPPDRFPVRRGEVLALSGQSATLGPHLHFEVRDVRQRPLDPQACGFAPPDTFPPRILRVRAIPATPGSLVGGRRSAVSCGGRGSLAGRLPDLSIRGPVAFTAAVVERSDVKGHRLEPYLLEVTLDDSVVFAARNERFPFSRQDRMALEWLVQGRRRERWLWRRPGNDLPGREGGDWSLDPAVLTPGEHEVRLAAADRAGNTATVAWRLLVVAPGEQAPPSPGWEPDPVAVTGRDEAGVAVTLTPFWSCRGDTCRPLASRPGCLAPCGLLVAPDTLTTAEIAAMDAGQGLVPLGWTRSLLAADWTVPRGIGIDLVGSRLDSLATGEAPASWAIYRQGDDGNWRFVGRPERREAGWSFTATRPGRYALLRDRLPPYLGPGPAEGLVHPGPEPVAAAVTPPRWEVVPVRLEDVGAGVDPDSVTARLDGSPLVVEPDTPRRRLLVELPDSLDAGVHRLVLRAVDRAGHPVVRRYRWRLVPPDPTAR